jgi:hypothetical protein
MGEISDRLGGRAPGELVRSADWNALVEEVDRLGARLVEAAGALEVRLADLDTRVEDLRAEHAVLLGSLEGIVARHLDIRLSTTRASYAIGERAELRAQVATLDGAPLPTPRPWVDFVTVWGRLQPLGGAAIIGAEGRSLSVQVDADGVARAQLVADAAEGLPEEVQTGFEVALQTRVGGTQDTIAKVLLDANTPAEAASSGAFRAVSQAYDRPSEPQVQAFADAFFLNTPMLVAVPTLPIITTRWRDHRASVLAIAKIDPDPTTPDAALGNASLQVTFRDWLSPWIVLDYLELPDPPDIVAVRDRLLDGITEDFAGSLQGVTTQIGEIVEDRGVLGRLRSFQLIDQALGTLEDVAGQPPFVDTLAVTVQQAVRVQQALEPAQASVATQIGRQPGIDALVQTAAGATGNIGALQATVAAVSEELEVLGRSTSEVSAGLQEVRETVSNLDGKLTVAVDREFTRLSNEVTDLTGQLVEVERLFPEPVKETLLDFHSKLLKVDQLEEAVNELRR